MSVFKPVTPNEILDIIKKLGPSSSPLDPFPTPCIKLIAEELVMDITRLINLSLETGEVPDAWKKGVVTALPKKAEEIPSLLSNYRPVTQLRLLARITEHITTSQFQSHLEQNHILHDRQQGFRPQRSTELAAADIRENLLTSLDGNDNMALILLDLSAAFDTVDHSILLETCEQEAGLTGTVLTWLKSFLSNRSQQVKFHGMWSKEVKLTCGVPQGSSLSPLLFNLYMLPLTKILDTFKLKYQIYADDIQIIVNLDTKEKDVIIPCLRATQHWMTQNYLKLNSQKTEILLLPGSKASLNLTLPWPPEWGTQPKPVNKTRDLGIMLDSSLDGLAHAATTIKACNHQLNGASRLFPLLTHKQKILLTQAWVGSRLRYGAFMYLGGTKKLIQSIQKVQNRAIRLIYSLPRKTKLSPWRLKLGWLRIQSLVDQNIATWIWKARHGLGPHLSLLDFSTGYHSLPQSKPST